MFTRSVAFFSGRAFMFLAKITDPRIAGYQISDTVVAVIKNNQFLFGIILLLKVFNRIGYELPAIESWHDARNQWHWHIDLLNRTLIGRNFYTDRVDTI
jgi:hypothetical protein